MIRHEKDRTRHEKGRIQKKLYIKLKNLDF